MTFRVGASLAGWSRQLRAYAADHAPDFEIVLVRDQRAALDPSLSVICLDLATVWVASPLVADIVSSGTTVVGMFSDERDQQQWSDWGVSHQMRVSVAPDAMVHLLNVLRPRTTLPEASDAPQLRLSTTGASAVVVGGPAGSGAREVAVGLADRFSVEGSTVLVDCNETGGTVAARLGLGEHPNLLAAVPLAQAAGDLARVLTAPAPGRPGMPFDVIGGLPSGAEWSRITPAEVQFLLRLCTGRWSTAVAVTGPIVEDLRRWADRFGVSRELLSQASNVVGVCAASPKGVLAFGTWLADARPQVPVQVIVNKVPAASPFVRGEVFDRLRSLCGDRIELVGALPWDRRVVRAEWDGTLVRRGPWAKALGRVAASLSLTAPAEVMS